MTTVKEEWDMACPDCSKDDAIHISAIVSLVLTPEGTVEGDASDHVWDSDCNCSCGHCGYMGLVKHFQIAA